MSDYSSEDQMYQALPVIKKPPKRQRLMSAKPQIKKPIDLNPKTLPTVDQ